LFGRFNRLIDCCICLSFPTIRNFFYLWKENLLGETNIADEKISKNPGREEIRKNIRPKRQLFPKHKFQRVQSKNKSRKCTIARRIAICKENAIHIDRSSARNPPEMWSHELPKDFRIHGKMRSHTRTWANLQAGSPWTQKSRLHRHLFWCYRGARASIGSKRAWSVHHIYFCQNYFWSCAQMV